MCGLPLRWTGTATRMLARALSEAGHPVCGDKVYCKLAGGEVKEDKSGAPRLALHATELGFDHPVTGKPMHWVMPLPKDLERFVGRLR